MDKTLHKKLTEKNYYDHTPTVAYADSDDMLAGFAAEMRILHNAAKDLLQPRPEAVARLLQMAKTI